MSAQGDQGGGQPAMTDAGASRPGAGTPGMIERAGESTPRGAGMDSAQATASNAAAIGQAGAPGAPSGAGGGGAVVGEYGPIRPNENLWNIATELKPQNATHQQMMMAY